LSESIRERGDPAAPELGRVELLGAVRLLGPLGARSIGRPQLQLVLALLVLEDRPVERGEVAEVLWGERALSPHWKGAVRGVLSKLREAFDEVGLAVEVVAGSDGTVRLVRPSGLDTDLEAAEGAIARAELLLAEGRAAEAAAEVDGWVERLAQPLLPMGDGDWVRRVQERVGALARRGVLAELAALGDDGRHDEAAAVASAWVHRHPLDEAVHERRIAALLAAGRRAEAIEAHRQLADELARELGVRPAASTTALLATSTGPASTPLLGRTDEVRAVLDQVALAVADRRPTFTLVTGPSGIGKTRLAEEVAVAAVPLGASVWWGRCLPGSGLPFEPVASLVREAASSAIDGVVAPAVAEALAAIVDGEAPSDEPDAARAHRFRTIAAAVRALAVEPVLLVLDDLQWAPADVIALLEHLLEEVDGPLAVVATGRNLPAAAHDALTRIPRSVPSATVTLSGLDVHDLLPLFGDRAHEEALDAASEVHRRTAGLPLFVRELRLAADASSSPVDPAALPDAVRDWVGHRIGSLERPVRSVLEAAAVVDPDLVVADLAELAGVALADALDAVELLVDLGFLVEDEQAGGYAFAHLITREVVEEGTSSARRAMLHLAAATLARRSTAAPGRHAAIARHLAAAGPEHRRDAAAAWAAAGREALDQGAWALAHEQLVLAIDAAGDDAEVRAEAMIGLAITRRHERRDPEALALLHEVVALARAAHLPFALGEAALVLVGRAGRGAGSDLTDAEQAGLLDEALVALDALARTDPCPDDRDELVRRERLACQLEGERALAGLYTDAPAERDRLTASAVARARRIEPPDPQLTARSLIAARISKMAGDRLVEREGEMAQVLVLPGVGVDARLQAGTYRAEDLLRLGDRAAADAAFDQVAALAAHHEHPYWTWANTAWAALLAIISGDLDRAEALAGDALALQGPTVDGALACYGVNLVDLRLYQGRAGEVLDLLGAAADANPHIPCYRAVLALCAAEAGDEALARRCYDALRADGFAGVPDDSNRLLSFVVLADVAARYGDVAGGRLLAAELEPSRSHQALLNCYGGGGAYWGPVAHQLARLAVLDGRHDEGAERFAEAERSARVVGAPLALARILEDPLRP
jgi:DNA-binding SARP family transcriptional activator